MPQPCNTQHRTRAHTHTQALERRALCLPCQLRGPSHTAAQQTPRQVGRQKRHTLHGAPTKNIYASSLYPGGRDKQRPVRDAPLLAQIWGVPANTGQLATLVVRVRVSNGERRTNAMSEKCAALSMTRHPHKAHKEGASWREGDKLMVRAGSSIPARVKQTAACQ